MANPGGRPRVVREVQELARQYCAGAIHRLAQLAGLLVDDAGNPVPGAENESTQVAAANSLLDRGYGKPAQSIAVTASTPAGNLSDAELERLISAARGIAAASEDDQAEFEGVVH